MLDPGARAREIRPPSFPASPPRPTAGAGFPQLLRVELTTHSGSPLLAASTPRFHLAHAPTRAENEDGET
jgi:hypothetical protein